MKQRILFILFISLAIQSSGCNRSQNQIKQSNIQSTSPQVSNTVNRTPTFSSPTIKPDNGDQIKKQGNTTGNILNNGFVAMNEKYIFYVNHAELRQVYRMNIDGSEKVKILNDSCSDLNINGDWIYYVNTTEPASEGASGSIYRAKLDGSERTKLNNQCSENVTVFDNEIYYLTPYQAAPGLYKMQLDGSNQTQLSNCDGDSLNITKDGAFYIDYDNRDNYVYCVIKVPLNNNKDTPPIPVTKDIKTMPSYVNIIGSQIYYSDIKKQGKLYKTSETGQTSLLCNSKCWYINVSGDWIYYSDVNNGSRIYKMKIDGTHKTKLNNDTSSNICVFDDWIYYLKESSLKVNQFQLVKMKTDGSNQTPITQFQG